MSGPVKPVRAYLDTSVFRGCFDEEFDDPSLRVFERIRTGDIHLLLGITTIEEIVGAPPQVRELLASLDAARLSMCPTTSEVVVLRDQYIERAS